MMIETTPIHTLPKEQVAQILAYSDNVQSEKVCKRWNTIHRDPHMTTQFVQEKLKEMGIEKAFRYQDKESVEKRITALQEEILIRIKFYTTDYLKKLDTIQAKGFLHFFQLLQYEYNLNLIKVFQITVPTLVTAISESEGTLSLSQRCSKISQSLKTTHLETARSIKKLKLKKQLTILPEEVNLFTEVEEVNFQNNRIYSIPKNFGKSWSKLKKLDLSINRISKIPKDFGTHWPLEEIILVFSEIDSIPECFGKNWVHLKKIDLWGSNIQSLPETFGKSWFSLESIRISGQIECLNPNFGMEWQSVTFVKLGNNKIQKLPEEFGKNWTELSLLRLSSNCLKNLPVNFGNTWQKLSALSVDSNLATDPAIKEHKSKWPELPYISH